MKIAFLNDTSAWYHWGCTGTSTAIKEMLARRGHTVASVPIDALHRIHAVPKQLADFDKPEFFREYFKANIAVTKPILECDAVVINGEGSLHHLHKLPLTILYLAYAAKKFCSKKVMIINHSCYPDGDVTNPTSNAAVLYRGVYRLMDFVAIREHKSQAVMQAIGVQNTILSFDCLPLYLRDHPLSDAPRGQTIVLAGSVAWKAQGIAALADYIATMGKQGYDIQVLTGAKAYPAPDDASFVKALEEAAPEGWTHVDATSMEQWLGTIQQAALMLSGRFHYTIAACMLGTPAVILGSNTPKNVALAEMANLPLPQDYTADNLAAMLRQHSEQAFGRAPISNEIKAKWQARAEQNFDGI